MYIMNLKLFRFAFCFGGQLFRAFCIMALRHKCPNSDSLSHGTGYLGDIMLIFLSEKKSYVGSADARLSKLLKRVHEDDMRGSPVKKILDLIIMPENNKVGY